MFKKKFDYNDLNNFLPDNKTVGTFDFYNKKFDNRMPEHISEICSVRALIDDEEEKQKRIKEILDKKEEYNNKLLNEFREREMDTNEEHELNEKIKKEEYINEINLNKNINNLTISNE
jgi:DNA-directed RNA polymerase beta' subunit